MARVVVGRGHLRGGRSSGDHRVLRAGPRSPARPGDDAAGAGGRRRVDGGATGRSAPAAALVGRVDRRRRSGGNHAGGEHPGARQVRRGNRRARQSRGGHGRARWIRHSQRGGAAVSRHGAAAGGPGGVVRHWPPQEGCAQGEGMIRAQSMDLAPLRAMLPEHCLLTEAEDTRPFECDGLTLIRQRPPVVALPETHAQLVALLRHCHARGIPVVPRGAGTGLAGSAVPVADGILLSMAKFNRILKVDAESRTAIVEPGVRNLAISDAARPFGLYYAPDPSSQIACSIGGNVAENSGGVHCLKYGLTLPNVLGVRALLADGEEVRLGGGALDGPGLDLLAVLVGSEGMLAVITEVTVRLVPLPRLARCIMASFADVEHAGDAVAALIAAGLIPAGLEMLDQAAARLVEPFVKAGYDLDAAAILLCESDGTPEEVEAEILQMLRVLEGARATRLQVSADETERQRFWAGRKNAFPAAGRAAPAYYCTDGTIPRRHIGRMLKSIQQMELRFGLGCPNVFHAGDGNLHPLVLFDDADPDSVARAEAFGAAILEESLRLGGTITGEHGVGMEKLNQMCSQFPREELDVFSGVKRAFDPAGLLNPGKVIPTLHRCAEYGRMPVHGGKLPFADLPRF
ncbi:MAG: FAD-binding protein [Proteobacteria bacterium]|nr:FAD-binding protein [Pseudomonadota bacterium]